MRAAQTPEAQRHKALARKVAEERGLPVEDVAEVVEHLLSVIREEVWRTGRFAIGGFGVFRVSTRKAKRVRAPDGSLVTVQPHKAVAFRASRDWRVRW